jgi:arsenate reductase
MSLPESEDEIVLLHNPRCSKSRATLALLEERGVDVAVRTYLEDPLSRDEIVELGRRLGLPVAAFTRKKQAEFAEAGLDDSSSEDELVGAMASTPILMERPILLRGKRAAIGRPPEDVLALLDD